MYFTLKVSIFLGAYIFLFLQLLDPIIGQKYRVAFKFNEEFMHGTRNKGFVHNLKNTASRTKFVYSFRFFYTFVGLGLGIEADL